MQNKLLKEVDQLNLDLRRENEAMLRDLSKERDLVTSMKRKYESHLNSQIDQMTKQKEQNVHKYLYMLDQEKQSAQISKDISEEVKEFETGVAAPTEQVVPGAKKQEKSYKEMMLLQKKANYQKFRKSMVKQTSKPRVVHLSISDVIPKRHENSVLSEIHQSPSF